MSTQARPLSFADQAFQNQKKKTKWQETFEKMEVVVPWERFTATIEPPKSARIFQNHRKVLVEQ